MIVQLENLRYILGSYQNWWEVLIKSWIQDIIIKNRHFSPYTSNKQKGLAKISLNNDNKIFIDVSK